MIKEVDTTKLSFDELLDIREDIMRVFIKVHKSLDDEDQENDSVYLNVMALYSIDNIILDRILTNAVEKLRKRGMYAA